MSPRGSVLWALLPLLTLGIGATFVLGWAAYRLRSRWLALGAAAALVVTIVAFSLLGSPPDSGRETTAGFLIIALIGGGLAITFTIRGRLVDPRRIPLGAPAADPAAGRPIGGWAAARQGGGDRAVEEALERRRRRLEARRLLEQDPALARELRIGRPDLPRRFDDGGLVDVNHVPAAVLAGLPGFTPEMAEHVVRVRDERHGFAYPQELEVFADLPDGLADELSERLIFLR
ncbi:hypothetical protein QWM81_13170 [Streptomyces ficellus]|uniref:Helix-hairpin-helix domain-containing protein n=1 Tax=Streptomyces ficellus TaxID=1977088 RepID=A0ABT7Z7D8_9ACTN|nr:hypothetical protein [Streptomyces ficellus]MDN3294986.1 hypothetical protein [Streptomyces ficellus]